MKESKVFNLFLLTITTIIWGSAFIFQDIGMEYLEPLTFNVARCLVCTLFLFILSFVLTKFNKKETTTIPKTNNKDLIIGGLVCGIFLGAAMATQQIGIKFEGAGRSGFITSLYIIFVPLIGLFFRQKVSPFIVLAILLSVSGLWLINFQEGSFSFSLGSICLLGCALFYAMQILAVARFTNKCDSIKLTALQFLFGGILQIPFMFIFENPSLINIIKGIGPILYCGILSSGIAFTLQVYTQKYIEASIASMIMSLESVFSIIFASIILKEKYSGYEIQGCILIFAGVIITQLPLNKLVKQKK